MFAVFEACSWYVHVRLVRKYPKNGHVLLWRLTRIWGCKTEEKKTSIKELVEQVNNK